MRTESAVVSQLPNSEVEHRDIFIVQDASGATKAPDGRFQLRVLAIHLRGPSGDYRA